MSLIAFRTDTELEAKLERAATKQKRTRTDVIREALELYLQNESTPPAAVPQGQRLSDALKSDIGTWNGPATASAETGKRFGDVLLEKYRRRV